MNKLVVKTISGSGFDSIFWLFTPRFPLENLFIAGSEVWHFLMLLGSEIVCVWQKVVKSIQQPWLRAFFGLCKKNCGLSVTATGVHADSASVSAAEQSAGQGSGFCSGTQPTRINVCLPVRNIAVLKLQFQRTTVSEAAGKTDRSVMEILPIKAVQWARR